MTVFKARGKNQGFPGNAPTTYTIKKPRCDPEIYCLGCLSVIPGFKKRVVSAAAFFPPSIPGYFVVPGDHPDGECEAKDCLTGMVLQALEDEQLPRGMYRPARHRNFKVSVSTPTCTVFLTNLYRDPNGSLQPNIRRLPEFFPARMLPFCEDKVRIRHLTILVNRGRLKDFVHAFWLEYPGSLHTVLFSHGNSTDIGLMFPYLLEFCRRLHVDVVSYDFAGYGASTGSPSEAGVYEEIEAVYRYFTCEAFKYPPSRIILYGQSIGSAPCVELATKVPDLGGLVIHAGMKSGLTVLKPGYDRVHWFDVFKNISKISRVTAPVFIVHGKKDLEIGVDHGMALYQACLNPRMCWWVDGAGHNDIEILHKEEYYSKLRSFINSINLREMSNNSDQ